MKIYVSAVPLTMVRLIDGGYRNVLQGEQVAGDAVEPENLKRHLRKGFLVEAEEAEEVEGEPKSDKVDDIVAEVGDDKEKAAEALEREKAGKNRKTLVEKLQAVLDA